MSLLKPTNSLTNNIMAASVSPVPEVGMGATALYYTDRRAGTIISVRKNAKGQVVGFTFQEDTATRVDKNGMSECQEYVTTPNPAGPTRVVTLRKNGRWVAQGDSMKNGLHYSIGNRSPYHDYSF